METNEVKEFEDIIKAYLKENLIIKIKKENCFSHSWDEFTIEVKLILDGETISSDIIIMPITD